MAFIDLSAVRQPAVVAAGLALLDGETLFHLGLGNAAGLTGTPDLVAAHICFNLAAHGGDARAAEHRQEIAALMTKSEIARALKGARTALGAVAARPTVH